MLTRPLVRITAIGLALLLGLALYASHELPRLAAARLTAAARARGLQAGWRTLDTGWPPHLRLAGLVLRHAAGDTLVAADSVDVALETLPLLFGHARPAAFTLARATIHLPGSDESVADTLAPPPDNEGPAVSAKVRERAQSLVRALLVPARRLPAIHLRDVLLLRGAEDGADLDALDLAHAAGGVSLAAAGTLRGEHPVPFDALANWRPDDQLTARVEFRIADPGNPAPRPLVVSFEGKVTQDRAAQEIRIAEGSHVTVGELRAALGARLRAAGPRLHATIDATALTADACRRSLPGPVLGVLGGLEVHGSWDWRAGLDVDLAQPDSVRFSADVIPHDLVLDAAGSRPSLHALAGPFTATIHLPHDQQTTRTLSEANPHFRPLARISPYLRDAVVTNEDGGFWHHRGFNTDAIGLAVAANLRAGEYRRGAGTITMQLARNLWLGHQRTLSRKGQEVVLAWLLEHETGIGKERLLEIYLNIIEWGPGVHGADEAARYYFDEDAAALTLPEALFLTIVVPSPARWRWRFSSDGSLRPYARAQMHFIAGKMAAKGWLGPALVPATDSLGVTLRGPARALFGRPDSPPARTDSLAASRDPR